MDFSLLTDLLSATTAAWAAFLSGFFEGLAIPFPGTWLLALLGGVSLPAGTLIKLGLLASLGYTAGALVPYYLGVLIRVWGLPAALPRFGLTDDRLQHLRDWFHRYGEPAVLWSRPLWIGNLVSIPAGLARMPLWKFVLYTFVGIAPWAFVVLWAGDGAGRLLEDLGGWAIWALVLGGAVVYAALWYRKFRQRRHQTQGATD